MRKYQNRSILLIAVFGAIFLSIMYVNPYSGTITLSELILQLGGSRGEFALSFSMTELLSFAMRLMPFFVLECYMGIAVYRHFCTASIYVFSRYPNRRKWYWREMISVGGEIMIFQGVLLFITILISMARYQVVVDKEGIILAVYYYIIYAVWVYKITVIINLAALWLGSSTSYAVVLGVQMIEITLLSVTDLWHGYGMLKYNPISRLVLGWQGSRIESLNHVLLQPYDGLDLNASLLFEMITCGILLAVGSVIVRKHNLLISDSETGV